MELPNEYEEDQMRGRESIQFLETLRTKLGTVHRSTGIVKYSIERKVEVYWWERNIK